MPFFVNRRKERRVPCVRAPSRSAPRRPSTRNLFRRIPSVRVDAPQSPAAFEARPAISHPEPSPIPERSNRRASMPCSIRSAPRRPSTRNRCRRFPSVRIEAPQCLAAFEACPGNLPPGTAVADSRAFKSKRRNAMQHLKRAPRSPTRNRCRRFPSVQIEAPRCPAAFEARPESHPPETAVAESRAFESKRLRALQHSKRAPRAPRRPSIRNRCRRIPSVRIEAPQCPAACPLRKRLRAHAEAQRAARPAYKAAARALFTLL